MENKLVEWVMGYADEYIEHRNQNYLDNWKKYERIWRGVWSGDERARESERSKFISPALQQAVENSVSEIEEALFGTKPWPGFQVYDAAGIPAAGAAGGVAGKSDTI